MKFFIEARDKFVRSGFDAVRLLVWLQFHWLLL
jgi:hypothetical protein